MKPSTLIKIQGIRSSSINSAFIALGLSRDEVYSRRGTRMNGAKSSFRSRNPYTDFVAWAEHLHKEAIRKWHPDLHPENQDFYTEKAAILNAALARVKQIEKWR